MEKQFMTQFLKKTCIAILVTLSSSTGYIQAACYDQPVCDIQPRIDEQCCEPCCNSCGYVAVDLLFWRAFESGLDICVPNSTSDIVNTSDGTVISTFSGTGLDPNFRWSPGFRLTIGRDLPCNNWDIALSWTHFHSNARGSNNSHEFLWNVNFDTIDLIAAYETNFCIFTLRPFGGLRGAIIDQKADLRQFVNEQTIDLISNETHNREKFRGIGPILGLGADWCIGCGFSLYAAASWSWLYGNFDVDLERNAVTVDSIDFSQIGTRTEGVQTVADAEIGVRWTGCFCDCYQLILGVGLEHHQYFSHNRIGACSGNGNGDLSFDGLNFSVGILF